MNFKALVFVAMLGFITPNIFADKLSKAQHQKAIVTMAELQQNFKESMQRTQKIAHEFNAFPEYGRTDVFNSLQEDNKEHNKRTSANYKLIKDKNDNNEVLLPSNVKKILLDRKKESEHLVFLSRQILTHTPYNSEIKNRLATIKSLLAEHNKQNGRNYEQLKNADVETTLFIWFKSLLA